MLTLVLALAAAGCGGDSGETGSGTDSGTASSAAEVSDRVEPLSGPEPDPALPVTVDSADGRKVTVDSADRIVPLEGSLSEIVFTLGLGDRVVARDITATFEQAEDLPTVTRGHDVSAESVLSLHPDVVLAEPDTGPEEAIDQIRAAGVAVVIVDDADDLDDVTSRITAVADALGVPEAGERLNERTTDRIEEARADVPTGENRPRVAFLYLRGSASVYLLGGAKSGATSLIEAAGGIDAGTASGVEQDFTSLTSEALVAAAPDVILVMTDGLESVGGIDGLLELPGVAQTPAGMDRRVAAVEDGVLLSYGPRTDQVIASLAEQFQDEGGGAG